MDEALTLLCLITMPLRRVIARQPLRDFPGQRWFAGFLVCGLFSGLVVQVRPEPSYSARFIQHAGNLRTDADAPPAAKLDQAEARAVRR